MNQVKEITLLPVNSYELEFHLTQLGKSIIETGKQMDFSKRCFGVTDCDFLQSAIIEFTAEIKTDFIAYFAIAQSDFETGTAVQVIGNELPVQVVADAELNAKQRGFKVISTRKNKLFELRRRQSKLMQSIKVWLFKVRQAVRYKQLPTSEIPRPQDGKFRLLMSTYHRNTIFTLTPIQDNLQGRSDIAELYIANRYETYKRLLALGYRGIINGWSIRCKQTVKFDETILTEFINRYFSHSFPYGNATLLFRRRFHKRLREKLLFLHALYSPMRRVIEEFNPNVLVLSSCSTADAQLLIHLCQPRNIRVIEMTHGMFQDTPLLTFQNVPVKLVWSERQRELMKRYRPEVDCPVIGNPKHDELLRKFNHCPPERPFTKKYILFASTPGNNISISWPTYLKILKDFVAASQLYPDMLFIMKLHPSEDLNKVIKEAKEFGAGNNFLVELTANVYELLFHAEIVMVLTSTVGFEALLWNKKLICYTIENSDKWLPFPAYGLAQSAANKDELILAIDYFLRNESMALNNEHRDYFAFSDGSALNNMLAFMLNHGK